MREMGGWKDGRREREDRMREMGGMEGREEKEGG
jgi:hypothetical protein